MDYKQVIQASRFYEYGEKKEFATRDEALKEIKKLEQSLKSQMAIKGIYSLSEVEIVEENKAFQIVITTKIPIIVK